VQQVVIEYKERTVQTKSAHICSRRHFLHVVAGGVGAALVGSQLPSVRPRTASAASGKLSVYSALNESTNNAFVEAFKKSVPGLNVELLPLAAAGELQTRIRTEKDSPKADVFIGGSSEFHSPLGTEGLLLPYTSPNAANVAPIFYKDPDGLWTGWYIGIFGFVLHTDRFAKDLQDLKPPTRWDDLLVPAWKGHLTMPDPVKTGGGYIFIATQIFRFAAAAMTARQATLPTAELYAAAEDKAMDYMKKLHANIGQYTGTAPQAIQLVGQGQFIGAPNWSHDILTAKSQGQPIDNLNPQPTGFEVGAVSIIKGGPNPDGAKAFVDWVLSKEAGALNVKLSNRLSVLKDVAPAPGAPTLESVQLVPYDRAWATHNKARLLKKWQAAIG
jgi:iron(III) transport system substrate-binding protein